MSNYSIKQQTAHIGFMATILDMSLAYCQLDHCCWLKKIEVD